MAQEHIDRLVDAALPHVVFDGWSEATLKAAAADCDIPIALAHALFPRGGIDMAFAFHMRGDALLQSAMQKTDLSAMRYRDRVAFAIRTRLEMIPDKEAVRRGAALFALPQYAPDGLRAVWSTADAIWSALGDTSRDVNWYTKRMTLSAVYSAAALFWLGDDSPDHAETWDFVDRRIDNVMQFEKAKAQFRSSSIGRALLDGPLKAAQTLRAPTERADLIGRLRRTVE